MGSESSDASSGQASSPFFPGEELVGGAQEPEDMALGLPLQEEQKEEEEEDAQNAGVFAADDESLLVP